MERKKRRDAIENRERLLVAAFDLLAERDPDLTVRELAVRTGLGVGTAYRHFATHEDLVRALYDRAFGVLAEHMGDLDGDATAWERLCTSLETTTLALADMPALRTVMRRMYDVDPAYAPAAPLTAPLQELIDAAIAEGAVRDGVNAGDVAVTVFSLAGLVGRPTDAERAMIRRQLTIVIDGLRAGGERTPLPDTTMTMEEFHVFLHRSNAPAPASTQVEAP